MTNPPARDGGAPRLLSVMLLTLTLVFLAWRATLGFDLRDSGYVAALSRRVAQGDVPFLDEVNPHILGSAPAAPVLWLWSIFFNDTGTILITRLWYVFLAGGAMVIAWRALTPLLGVMLAAIASASAILALPYNLEVVSYNTIPQLCLLVAFSCGVRSVDDPGVRWSLLCGIFAVTAGAAYFAILPASIVLVLTVLSVGMIRMSRNGDGAAERFRYAGSLLGGALCVGLGFLLWLTIVPGWQAVQQSYDFLAGGGLDRGTQWAVTAAFFLAGSTLLPLATLGLAAVVLPMKALGRGLLLTASVLAVAAWAGEPGPPGQEPLGPHYAGAAAMALIGTLGLPLLIWLVRRRDRVLLLLVAIATPVTVAGVLTTTAVTMSGPLYGAYAVAFPGMIVTLVTFLWLATRSSGNWAAYLASASVTVVMAASLSAWVFNEGSFLYPRLRVAEGPAAGLLLGPDTYADQNTVADLVARCSLDHENFWVLWAHGAYLWIDGSDAPQYWVGPSEVDVAYSLVKQRDFVPTCILAPTDLASMGGVPAELDTLIRSDYRSVDGGFVRTVDEAGTHFTLYELKTGQAGAP